jgi:hypothetical protein
MARSDNAPYFDSFRGPRSSGLCDGQLQHAKRLFSMPGGVSVARAGRIQYRDVMRYQRILTLSMTLSVLMAFGGCGDSSTGGAFSATGGTGGVGAAGTGGRGGIVGTGGTTGTGGMVGTGGTTGAGGIVGTGGTTGGGGMTGTGGTSGAGGMVGTGGTTGAGGATGSGGTTGTGGAGATSGGCHLIQCDGRVTICGDCMDNDGDGLVDNADPECLGPCDNTEGPALLTGVGGETGNQCGADCYFDFGNGSGGGDCKWNRSCDPLEPKLQCPYVPGLAESEGGTDKDCPVSQPALCEETCVPLTPNGCDCFGCCTFPELEGMGPGGGDGYVFLGSETDSEGTCTFATVTDPALCRACTPAGNCLNTCERCEICLGKPTIPDDCFPGTGGTGGTGGSGGTGGMGASGGAGGDGGGMRCPVGKQVCGLAGDDPCPAGSFCLTGCCTQIIVQ